MATPSTTAEVIVALGADSQEKQWAAAVILDGLAKSIFSKLMSGSAGGRAIATVSTLKNLQGQYKKFYVEAGLGGPGEQGAGATRATGGENLKGNLFELFFGNHHKSVILNRVVAAQTVIGKNADTRARAKLAPWFMRERESATEAEIIKATTAAGASNIVYASSSATSIEGLRSAHYADSALFRRIGGRLADNQAKPFAVAMEGAQELKRYVILAPERGLDELSNDPNWQTLMAQAGMRGKGNYLFSGAIPSWNGSTVLPWTVETDSSNGPQGCFAQPMAFLGAALDFSTDASALTITGGGSAAAAALTDHLYYRFFPGAAFSSHEDTKIAQETGTTKYALLQDATTGLFGMISYTITNGNTITAVKHLGATTGTHRAATVGNVTYNTGVWAGKHTTSFAIGSKVVPCNSYGQPFIRLYGLGMDSMMHGFGGVMGGSGAGKLTENKNDDMQRYFQPGFEEQWGITTYKNANGRPDGLVMAYAAYNLDGMPQIE
ncbi:MAG: DUF4043 family protein [Prosthecobacter sp.]